MIVCIENSGHWDTEKHKYHDYVRCSSNEQCEHARINYWVAVQLWEMSDLTESTFSDLLDKTFSGSP